ncbi:protein translocase subunit SecF [Anaerocolumna chitinilytica]|uniref:Protein-export membrane protein SecF n=1 Tax=Anaerocolumna chitinilytica TaxID=1727145 RepID=A0A7I8DSR4_9FIRM|nr:protein translocase subunit SecF [Anaerocolumna chitinilytica]BCJ99326.1 protein-export membrane protein SecF [Anaerocolumna chitinilytica]
MNNENNNASLTIAPTTGKIIHFFSKRFIYFAFSLTIMIIGLITLATEGVQLDIQFKGGAMLKYTYTGDISADDADNVASEILGRPVSSNITEDMRTGDKRLVLNIAGNYGVDAKDQVKFDDALKAKFPDNKLELSESSMVEPFFGHKFLTNGVIAIVLSFSLVLVYVWIRFKKIGGLSAGFMAIVALVHDVLVVFFTCVVFRIPIGDSFVAVALSIIGYSVNDTIVIYDRIRENHDLHPKLEVDTLTDLSISQSITRSLNTNFAVFLSVTLVYVMAHINSIDSIQSFALPMAIGSVSGCYSTICIAGPLWVMWQKHKAKKAEVRR